MMYNNSMPKGLLILIFLGLVLPLLVSAIEIIKIENPLGGEDYTFRDFIDKIITFLFNVALAVVPLMVVIAGFYLVTAAGEPARIQTAKNIILYTIVGFVIILLAKGFIALLEQILQTP